jgi:cytidylate kinase
MVPMEPVIAIDGPSGAGKSSVARALALRGGWRYLDTGALYRSMTLGLLHRGLAGVTTERSQWICERESKIKVTAGLEAEDPKIFCDGMDVGREIRSAIVTKSVSEVSALPCVRSHLLSLQHELIGSGGIVVEGRDIGSVVWPLSEVKFYLTADLDARARRRHAQEVTDQRLTVVESSLAERDLIDSERSISPLTIAAGAVLLDTTELEFDEVVSRMWDEIGRRLAS